VETTLYSCQRSWRYWELCTELHGKHQTNDDRRTTWRRPCSPRYIAHRTTCAGTLTVVDFDGRIPTTAQSLSARSPQRRNQRNVAFRTVAFQRSECRHSVCMGDCNKRQWVIDALSDVELSPRGVVSVSTVMRYVQSSSSGRIQLLASFLAFTNCCEWFEPLASHALLAVWRREAQSHHVEPNARSCNR